MSEIFNSCFLQSSLPSLCVQLNDDVVYVNTASQCYIEGLKTLECQVKFDIVIRGQSSPIFIL